MFIRFCAAGTGSNSTLELVQGIGGQWAASCHVLERARAMVCMLGRSVSVELTEEKARFEGVPSM